MKIALHRMMIKMQVFMHLTIAEKRALVLMHGALSNNFSCQQAGYDASTVRQG
jgi:hypothetical protein